jgi:hypothetical protein
MIRSDIESAIQVADRLGDADGVAILRADLAALDRPSENIQSLVDASIPVAEVSDHG